MSKKDTLNNNLKQLLEEYFITSKETVAKLQEVEELSKNLTPETSKEIMGKLKKAGFLYNLYSMAMAKNIAKIKNVYPLCKILGADLSFTLDGAPDGAPVSIEEIVQKIIETDVELVGVVNGKLVILDSNLEDAINNRMENMTQEELAQIINNEETR